MTAEDMKKLALLWLLPLAVLAYAAIAAAYPYYATWDSTQIYTLDALIAGAGQLPDHIFHPNMLPLVLERYVLLPLGELAGWISVASITELQAAPHPYLSFVETAEYLLRVGYVFAVVFLAFTYLTIFRLLEPQLTAARGRVAGFLALTLTALALVWQHLPFMLIWVRHETVGIAMWSIALYATVRAADRPERRRWVVVAGLLSGAAAMSKIQLVGGVAALPFLYAFLAKGTPAVPGRRERWITAALAVGAAGLVAVVHWLAKDAFEGHALPRVAFDTKLESLRLAPIAPICVALLAGAAVVLSWTERLRPRFAGWVARGVLFGASCLAVLPLALSLGSTPSERLGALCWTYIHSFGFGQFAFSDATGYLKPIVWGRHAPLFVASAVAVVAVVVGYVRHRDRLPRARLVAGIAAAGIAVAAIALLSRPSPRKDGLLVCAWATLAALVAWRMLLALYAEKRVLLLGCGVAWLWVGLQIAGLAGFQAANYQGGGYDYATQRWRDFNYGHRGKQYRTLMRRAYPGEAAWRVAFDSSLDVAGTKLLLAQLFRDRHVRLAETALAVEGGALDAGGRERVRALSPQLEGALLVPIRGDRVEIGVRADLDVYCVAGGVPRALQGSPPAPTALRFETARKGAAAKAYAVSRLAPGQVTLALGGEPLWIAVRDGNAAALRARASSCTP